MHVLIVPSAFSGSLTAGQAATAMAQGWAQAAPHDVLATVPISDGGSGFVEAVAATAGGRLHACVTTDPLGRSVPATILLTEVDGRRTAYVESAQAAGLHLLTDDERDPTRTTSFGVGALLSAALDLEATRIVVGLGGSGTNDAGAGLLSALGVGSRHRLGAGGLALLDTSDVDLDGLEAARDRFSGIDLVAATDTEAPLLGLKGTSAMSAVGKGASEQQAQRLENAIGHFASVVSRVRPPAQDLLSGALLRPVIVDLCCGTGALGAAMARELPDCELHAADIDPAAVACAAGNIAPFGGRAHCGDLFTALPDRLRGNTDLIVANAPYVPTAAIDFMPREARLHEPDAALNGGADGLALHRRIAEQVGAWLKPSGVLLLECSAQQAASSAGIMAGHGFLAGVATSEALDGVVVMARRRPPKDRHGQPNGGGP